MLPPEFLDPDSWREADRTAFHDRRYPTSWISDLDGMADTLRQAAGFYLLDADRLAEWMRLRLASGAPGATCVLLHGVAPDTVYESATRECLARRYMDAGGRLVWIGDLPFYYRGNRRGGYSTPNVADPVLGVGFAGDVPGPTETTPEGLAWGFRPGGGGGSRGIALEKASVVLCRVGGHASSFLLNFNRHHPLSGFIYVGSFGGATWGGLEQLIRVATHGLRPVALPFSSESGGASEMAPSTGGTAPQGPGELVQSGRLRIDRDAALDKLRRLQLKDPASFLLPWTRCAVSSGAREWKVGGRFNELEWRFDGSPLEAATFDDPFAAFFEEAPSKDRRLHLAYGLLATFRLPVARVSIESGIGAGRRRVVVHSPKRWEPAAPEEATHTLLRVRWIDPVRGLLERRRALARLRVASWAEPPVDLPSLAFDEKGLRGWVAVPPPIGFGSRIDIHVLGAYACTADVWTWPARVVARVDTDRLQLNLSQDGVVRNPGFDAVVADLAGPIGRLLEQVLPEQARMLPEVARRTLGLKDRALWASFLYYQWARNPPAAVLGRIGRLALPSAGELRRAAAVAAFLWASDLPGSPDSKDPIMDVPLYLSASGETLTRRRALELRRERGHHAVSFEPFSGNPRAKDVVWLSSGCNERLFRGEDVKHVDDELARGPGDA